MEPLVALAPPATRLVADATRTVVTDAVGQAARAELEEMLDRKVHLFLQVKVRPGWLTEAERYSAIGLDFTDGKS